MKLSALTLPLAAAMAFSLAGCGKKEEAASGPQVIQIGQVSPLTGPQAHIGKDLLSLLLDWKRLEPLPGLFLRGLEPAAHD